MRHTLCGLALLSSTRVWAVPVELEHDPSPGLVEAACVAGFEPGPCDPPPCVRMRSSQLEIVHADGSIERLELTDPEAAFALAFSRLTLSALFVEAGEPATAAAHPPERATEPVTAAPAEDPAAERPVRVAVARAQAAVARPAGAPVQAVRPTVETHAQVAAPGAGPPVQAADRLMQAAAPSEAHLAEPLVQAVGSASRLAEPAAEPLVQAAGPSTGAAEAAAVARSQATVARPAGAASGPEGEDPGLHPAPSREAPVVPEAQGVAVPAEAPPALSVASGERLVPWARAGVGLGTGLQLAAESGVSRGSWLGGVGVWVDGAVLLGAGVGAATRGRLRLSGSMWLAAEHRPPSCLVCDVDEQLVGTTLVYREEGMFGPIHGPSGWGAAGRAVAGLAWRLDPRVALGPRLDATLTPHSTRLVGALVAGWNMR